MDRRTVLIYGVIAIIASIMWVAFGLAFPTPNILPTKLIWGPPAVAATLGALAIVGAVIAGRRR